MVWKVGKAKQQFSEVLRRAADEPQLIHNRDRLVAAVLGPEDTAQFLAWHQRKSATLSRSLGEARRICTEEGYALEVERRIDRPNPLLRVADARRHQRRQ
jgi:hypothetical protein